MELFQAWSLFKHLTFHGKPEVSEVAGIFSAQELLFRHLNLLFFLTLAPVAVPYI